VARLRPGRAPQSQRDARRSPPRRLRRIERLQRASDLPAEKTLATLDKNILPAKVQKLLPTLCDGDFVERGDNVLAFGLPGRGKTHLVCAIGHELVRRGRRVWFTPTFALVQMLLAAKRDLRLEKQLAALDVFDAVILDDIGYVQQDRDEMEVLFTFLAQRYERRSVIITSNLLFRDWDRIFKDPMTTAAAIDRLVHHAVIVEMTGQSIRETEAKKRGGLSATTTATTPHCSTRIVTGWGSLPHEFCYRRGRQGGGDDGEDQRGRATGAGAGDR
jgi:DNA replication protein DnaC